jgi:hypothetical protein
MTKCLLHPALCSDPDIPIRCGVALDNKKFREAERFGLGDPETSKSTLASPAELDGKEALCTSQSTTNARCDMTYECSDLGVDRWGMSIHAPVLDAVIGSILLAELVIAAVRLAGGWQA